jgi:heptosyltransferase I
MKVLIIKMSSLGDVVHTLPALTDAAGAIKNIQFDWVVESAFSQIPSWHPCVNRVIPIAFRRLRKTPIRSLLGCEWRAFRQQLRQEKYDLIIDAQGLMKSALMAVLAKGVRAGLDQQSARESLAGYCYSQKYAIDPSQHAVLRTRLLFAKALGYALPKTPADYRIDRTQFPGRYEKPYFIFLHGTTWATKCWPEAYWIALAEIAEKNQQQVYLPWGNETEKKRAERIAAGKSTACVLPRLSLPEVTAVIAHAKAGVSVDTGLAHLAAALSVPLVSLYGPTDAKRTGTCGKQQVHLQADFPCSPCLQRACSYRQTAGVSPPCFEHLTPALVWQQLEKLG